MSRLSMPFLLTLCLLLFGQPAFAQEEENVDDEGGAQVGLLAMPGSNWVGLSWDNDGVSGSGAMGNIQQGIDWVRFENGLTLNTYVEYRYRGRELNNLYYDAEGWAVGIQLKYAIFALGANYYVEHFPQLGETYSNPEYYLSWFYGWNLEGDGDGWPDQFPGSCWAYLSYDINGLNGSGVMGYLNQGVLLFSTENRIDVKAFAEVRHRSRTLNKTYYDTEGFALGLEATKSVVNVGVNYYWERLPALEETSNRVQAYITWFITWDLLD